MPLIEVSTQINILRQCLINGEIVCYDVCSDNLESGRNFYGDRFTYIGSSKVYFINGTRNEMANEFYFFIKTN